MKFFGSITELVSTVFRKNSQSVTLRPNQTTTYTASRDVQLPEQDTDSVLVSRTSTDTLLNKTLSNPMVQTHLQIVGVAGQNQPFLSLAEDPDVGTDRVEIQAPSALSASYTLTLPPDDGAASQVLTTNGSGVLSWSTVVTNPMTTTGDIIYSSDNLGTPARLPVGVAGTVLKGGTIPFYASIVNADVSASAAIAYSKLSLANSIVNADVNTGAAIAYSKLNLASSIVNADVAAAAAISFSKLAALSSTNILVGNSSNVASSVPMTGAMRINNTGLTTIMHGMRASEGGGTSTLTIANTPHQTFDLTSDYTVVMPTTGVVAGDVWRLDNRNASSNVASKALTIQSSGLNEIATIDKGYVVLLALQSAPTTAAHWFIIDLYSVFTFAENYVFNGGGGGSGTQSAIVTRNNRQVIIQLPTLIQATTGTGSTTLSSQQPLPARYRAFTAAGTSTLVPIINNAASITTPGIARVTSAGTIQIFRDITLAAFTNSANAGISNNASDFVPLAYSVD